jgi:hypothetical protein
MYPFCLPERSCSIKCFSKIVLVSSTVIDIG